MLEVLAGTQLGVGHVDEVIATEQRAQVLHVALMNRIVGAVAVIHLVSDGHRSVGGDIESKDQLF